MCLTRDAGHRRASRSPRSAFGPRARAGLLWGLALFVGGQLALLASMESWCPRLRDPEYGRKLARLRARRKEAPADHRLVLALGSSRVAMGLRPALLRPVDEESPPAMVFNFGITGAGPTLELLYLHRLLADGVRPDLLLVEVWPPLMSECYQADFFERNIPLVSTRFQYRDWSVLRPYCSECAARRWQWCAAHAVPCVSERFCWLSQWAPAWLPATRRQNKEYRHLDPWGWLWIEGYSAHDEAAYRSRLVAGRALFGYFLASFRPSEAVDRAVRDLVTLCKQQRIPVALLFMPESSDMRGWYVAGPAGPAAYLRRLCREVDVGLIDARDWVADVGFIDGHHMTPEGAAGFTRRLGREVVGPLLAGPRCPADRSTEDSQAGARPVSELRGSPAAPSMPQSGDEPCDPY
jgi:hypothetical protein